MYEATALARLREAGGAVPTPYGSAENAILMDYIGDRETPAPTLSQVRLDPSEAPRLFAEAVRNIGLMLRLGIVHGDLSAYNLLYWRGGLTVIDFPQMTALEVNPSAAFILRRDVTRVCEYFANQGVSCDPDALFGQLWAEYAPAEL
jgi:RIO kinase 1